MVGELTHSLDKLAPMVKLADLQDNMDPDRLSYLPPKTPARLLGRVP